MNSYAAVKLNTGNADISLESHIIESEETNMRGKKFSYFFSNISKDYIHRSSQWFQGKQCSAFLRC